MESLLPFLQGTCTPYNMPVYPGAQRKIANALTDTDGTPWRREDSPIRPSANCEPLKLS
jgi:hypothetical protein